ncbi:hypothetical protein ASPWEDRAFT_176354 [Aspergillus wentii DTO 134E9]|uniref:Arrestin-like N-terminal domain-containing protein n=1 Tax=Aspergillus wentii DTO 134E9 TaxID=1073089 RepID=A0A1L9R8L0_ASPWE|nr:uncharacterized protein ASPWEDRAFT_176354 [Aspergillus wentii DTO 134E9]OJJ31265.1 hypothetical protein ASPWEDRAFT_176354 [Aspergillus wentii DTO 134E9]
MKNPFRNICSVDFCLNGSTFSIDDRIEGHVILTPNQPIRPELILSFQGATTIDTDTTPASQTFLNIQHPIKLSSFDTDSYKIPFEFTVSRQLPSHVCHHQCSHAQVHNHHLLLPPSIGRDGLDMSPDIVSIEYCIRLVVNSEKEKHEWAHPIQIISPRDESPPLLPPDKSRHYRLSRTKHLNGGLLHRRSGFLSAQAIQPSALHLQSKSTPTLAVDLHYIGTNPPPLTSIRTTLNAITFFGSEPWTDYPDQMDCLTWHARQNWCRVSLALESPEVPEWKLGKDAECGWDVYTASVEIPIILPDGYSYPPTFFSCLVARVYALKVVVGYQDLLKSRISLKIPLQIC